MSQRTELAALRTRYNRALVLNLVRRNGAASRTHLRQSTRLRLPAITELVRGLCEDGLLVEAGLGGTGRGRKHILLRLNTTYRYAVGVEFDADHVIGVVVDFELNVVASKKIRLGPGADKETVLAGTQDCIAGLLANNGVAKDSILGVGVADPGLVDRETGVSVLSSTIEDWFDVPVRAILEGTFSVPVVMEENTRAKTLAERRFGAGRSVDYLLFIDVGLGIGCGVITPQGLYCGWRGSAGELGHTYVADTGQVCRCGSYGCLEAVASLPAVAQRARSAIAQGAATLVYELAGRDLESVDADQVFEAARQGDKLALRLVDETCEYLGIGIANAVNLFNPQMVVLDARLRSVEDLMLAPIKGVVRRRALRMATEDLEFRVSTLGLEAGALGVAALVIDKVFEIPQLPAPDLAVED